MLEVSTFRKKPVVIEAVQFNGSNGAAIAEWCGGRWLKRPKPSDPTDVHEFIQIPTLEGVMVADVGDWIIRGVAGEFYPCKPETFETTYEPVT